jgi:hypothetical protein
MSKSDIVARLHAMINNNKQNTPDYDMYASELVKRPSSIQNLYSALDHWIDRSKNAQEGDHDVEEEEDEEDEEDEEEEEGEAEEEEEEEAEEEDIDETDDEEDIADTESDGKTL